MAQAAVQTVIKKEELMKQFIDFTGKVCLVTGAGSENGIGFQTAKLLGALGGRVVMVSTTDRIKTREEELKALGADAEGIIADLMDRSAVQQLVKKVISEYGSIDVLVNNAGMVQTGVAEEEFENFEDITYEGWDEDIARNLNITFNVTKEVLPHMKKASYGRIVNTSSVTGPLVSNPGEASYSAAKAAVIGMSKAIAIEVGRFNITVNNVLPGWIQTASQAEGEYQGGFNTPMKRSGTAEEVANMIVFLCSDKASYVTGQEFVVDGGNIIQEYKGAPEFYY